MVDINRKDIKFINQAAKMCILSTENYQIGAVLVCKNKVVSVGYNTNRNSSLQFKYTYKRGYNPVLFYTPIHAEISCLQKIKHLDLDMSKSIMYVCRLGRNGELRNSKPCVACMAAMRDFGVKYIVYSTHNGINKEMIKQ
jgi:tRNA(Arg) A34 adenosine deaminase TadA